MPKKPSSSNGDHSQRPFNKRSNADRPAKSNTYKKDFSDRKERPSSDGDAPKRRFDKGEGRPSASGDRNDRNTGKREYKKPFEKREGAENKRPYERKKPFEQREGGYKKRDEGFKRNDEDGKRDFRKPRSSGEGTESKRPYERKKPFEQREGGYKKRDEGFKRNDEDGKRDFRKPRSSGEGTENKRPYERKKPFEQRNGGYKKRDEGFKRNDEDGKRDFRKPRNSGEGTENKRPYERKKPFERREDNGVEGSSRPRGNKKPFDKKDKPFDKNNRRKEQDIFADDKSSNKNDELPRGNDEFDSFGEPRPRGRELEDPIPAKKIIYKPKHALKATSRKRKEYDEEDEEAPKEDSPMPLNKYISYSGECSRRDAAELVKQGKVKVNDELVTDPGYKVAPGDRVTLVGKKLSLQKNLEYILLNKPKDFITTNDDPQGRKTVMDLVANSGVERLFPVGRLDRNTTGLLLLTNDGDLTQKLSHPSHEIKKVYQVTLDKPLTKADFDTIAEGVTLEDGLAKVDSIAILEKKNEIGLEIHSGKNRIVRRIFESLGYVVEKLDRVMYAGLTKKNLPRGKWRFLTEQEKMFLKHFKN